MNVMLLTSPSQLSMLGRVFSIFLGALVATGCGALLGVDFDDESADGRKTVAIADAGASADEEAGHVDQPVPIGPDGACSEGRKRCDDLCVSRADPAYGCDAESCAPCAIGNGTAKCAGITCSVASCNDGYVESGGACVDDVFLERISAGWVHSCGVKTDGTVACWGNAVGTPPGGTFRAVSAAYNVTCGLKTDGSIVCWGDSANDLLTAPAGTFRQVSVGFGMACALKADSSVVCWGKGSAANLPTGTFRQVSVGQNACGVRTDSTLACWGAKAPAQYDPTPSGTFVQVSAGVYTLNSNSWATWASALRTDGSVTSWYNECSDSTPCQTIGIASAAGTFKQVTTKLHSCGLKADDTVTCWGDNTAGQAPATHDGAFRQISAGRNHTCGIKTDGTVACWGRNTDKQSTPPPDTFW